MPLATSFSLENCLTITAQVPVVIPLDQIIANEFALRGVDVEDPDVLRMFDNIAEVGVLIPIRVRPALGPDHKTQKLTTDGRPKYSVIDGLHRFTGALRAKLPELSAIIVSADDAQVEKEQLMANLHRIPTKPYEYGKHLKAILGRDQTKTLLELADELKVSSDFIERRMGLINLHKDGVDENGDPTSTIGAMVDAGKITLANAVELAKLRPTDEQLNFVTDAVQMTTLLFGKKVTARIKELKDAKRAGRDPSEKVGFVPTPHFRRKEEVEAEIKQPSAMSVLIKAKGISDPVEAALFALRWSVSLDEQSIAAAKAKHDAREKERAAEVAARKAEREKRKQDEDVKDAEAKRLALTGGIA